MNTGEQAGDIQPFPQFPKVRLPLPQAYLSLYESEYLENRTSGSLANRTARMLESWMHAKVTQAAAKRPEELLEIGAGTLNHIPWERSNLGYDIVEPFRKLFETSANLKLVRSVYNDIREIPNERRYDRILSVAVLEHILDLPSVIALSGLHLHETGVFCAGIPSEGGRLWEIAWRYGTGASFHRRTGLDYAVMMRHEHVNTATEIESCVGYFFRDVRVTRFPLRPLPLSLYTFLRAIKVDKRRCIRFLEFREI
jgi:hypothetical protein